MSKISKTYKISDALRFLGMEEEGRDRLFYWIKHKRLITPEIQGRGRGARSKLSMMNIVELAVIKELADIGIELNSIEELLKKRIRSSTVKFENGKERLLEEKTFARYLEFICDIYQKKTKENEDHYILIYKDGKGKYQSQDIGPLGFIEKVLKVEGLDFGSAVIIVDLFEILREIEKKTGEKI